MEPLSQYEIFFLKGLKGPGTETIHSSYRFLGFKILNDDTNKGIVPTYDEFILMLDRLERLGLIQIGINYVKTTPYGMHVMIQLELFESL